MNYTINEIPDEAVELSGNEMIPIWQGETKKVSVATLASSGIPVGAVMPFANGTTSEDWLLCDGRDTTGTAEELQTHYPALYTYLGNSNILPVQFDHSKLSDRETVAITTTGTTMDYDGYLFVSVNGGPSPQSYALYINSDTYSLQNDMLAGGTYANGSYCFPFRKGDKIRTGVNAASSYYAQFYKQYLYIKAT